MISIPRRFWLLGITAAMAVHAAIVVAVYWQSPESGARGAGRGGIQVSLGPAGGAPGDAVEVDGTPEVEAVEPEAEDEQAVTEVEDAVPVEADIAQVESAEPGAADEQSVTEAEEAVPDESDSARVESAETVDMTTATLVEPVETPTETQLPAQERPDGAQQPEPAQPAEPESGEASAPSVAGTGGQAGSGETASAGSGDSAAGGGTPGASPDYLARLRAWLEKHKRYPRRARLRRQEGTAMLSFVVDREGRVVEYSIRESSGHRILDEEVVAMIERAQPLPGFPDDLQRPRLELVVPVQFFLM